MCADKFAGNDNAGPTRLDELVADAIEDFVVRAELGIEEDEEPIEAAPALIELAAAAMQDVFLNSEFHPDLIIEMVVGRMVSLLGSKLERSQLLQIPAAHPLPHLTAVEPADKLK